MHTARVWAAAAALAVVVALACTGCAAADDTYTIVGYLQLPPNAPRDASLPTTKISVNGGEFSTVTRRDGSFKVNDVPPGKHLVEALSLDYVYPQVRLQISSEGKFQVFEYKMPGSAREKGSYPLSLKPVMGASYFQVRQGVDFMSFFKNPMMLMMLFSMVMIGVLPKMMKNMGAWHAASCLSWSSAAAVRQPSCMRGGSFGTSQAPPCGVM